MITFFWILRYFHLNISAQELQGRFNEEEEYNNMILKFKNQKTSKSIFFSWHLFYQTRHYSPEPYVEKEGNFYHLEILPFLVNSLFWQVSEFMSYALWLLWFLCIYATWIKDGSESHLHWANTAT